MRVIVKKTNEWVQEKTEVKRILLENVKKKKLSYFKHQLRKCASLEKEIVLRTLPEQHHRGRPFCLFAWGLTALSAQTGYIVP